MSVGLSVGGAKLGMRCVKVWCIDSHLSCFVEVSGACLAGLSVLAMAKWVMKYKFNEWMVAQSLHPFQEWALIMKSSTLMNRITNRWKEWDVCNLT